LFTLKLSYDNGNVGPCVAYGNVILPLYGNSCHAHGVPLSGWAVLAAFMAIIVQSLE
jgi:hypothetical protein